jgi:predicted dehydrogenase
MFDEQYSRRAFLKKTVMLTAALAAVPHARVLGANGDVRMGIVGLGNKGTQHAGVFHKMPGVRVVALCDPDPSHLKNAIDKHFSGEGEKPKTYADVRKMLEDKDIDAVLVATPNHWHAPVTVWACQAGKDVYVEKPATHTLWEGQQMIAAAEKYNRIVQVGTQSRSDSGLQAALQHIKEGNIGDIQSYHGIYYNGREPIGKVSKAQPIPEGVDYNLWLGPAPDEPLMRKKLHYDWHWQWPYGNGELGNNGVHMLDIAMWFMGTKEFPKHVVSLGGRFMFDDDGQTPNTQSVFYDFGSVPVVMELRNLPRWKGQKDSDNMNGHRVALRVNGSDGYFLGYGTGGWSYDNNNKRVKQFPGDGGKEHHQNFIDAVRSRKADTLAADVAAGHLSAGLAHLGNISHRLGKPAKGQKIYEAAEGKPLLHNLIDEFNEHLLVNNVDVNEYPRQLGPWLTFDPATQKFTGEQADEANALLKKEYR